MTFSYLFGIYISVEWCSLLLCNTDQHFELHVYYFSGFQNLFSRLYQNDSTFRVPQLHLLNDYCAVSVLHVIR